MEPSATDRRSIDAFAALPYLACLVSCLPFLLAGFPRGHDWQLELVRNAEYEHALAAGQLPPYWAENLYGGYGSPVFLFYPHVFALCSTLLRKVVGSYSVAASAAITLFSFVAVATMRAAAGSAGARGREPTAAAARVATYVFLLHPYLLADKLLRNADAEFAALCCAPLALHGVLLAERSPRQALTFVAAGLGLVILTHNLTALTIVALVVGLGFALHAPSWRRLAAIGAGIGLAAGLAAFYWLPAIALERWVRTEDLLTGKFDFHGNFSPLATFLGHSQVHGAGWLTPVLLAVCLGACASAGVRRAHGRLLLSLLVGAAALLFLQLRASAFLWESLPYLALFQFPWRFMGPLALVTALGTGLVFCVLTRNWPSRTRRAAEIAVLALCLLDAAPRLAQYVPLPRGDAERLSDWLRPETIRAGVHRVTVRDEFLPPPADAGAWRPDRGAGPVVGADPPAGVQVLGDRGTSVELRVETTRPGAVRLARWYFPGWSARRDGEPAPVGSDAAGRVELQLPAGESVVELRLAPPLPRRIGLGISAVSALVWIALAVTRERRPKTTSPPWSGGV